MKKSLVGAVLALLLSPTIVWAQFDHSHSTWDKALKQFMTGELVNYKALKANPTLLNQYLDSLKSISKTDYQKWTRNQKLAMWVNAYNAYTWKAIIDNYPIKSSFLKSRIYPKNSIRQIDGVWDDFKYNVMGEMLTLNDIEHKKIRPVFNEPKIHMALVCAALGCPPLRREAFTAEKLDAQFDDNTKQFLANPLKFKIDRSKNDVYISMIFKWFSEDFNKKPLNFIAQYLSKADADFITSKNINVEYLKYDWTLNEQ